jgi:thiamine biosynthesis protein ThiS
MTTQTPINVIVNGRPRELPAGISVDALLEALGMEPELIAVEVNRDLVRKRDFGTRRLADGDQIEVVEFVGGG